jgi:hypothetical protein
MSAEPHPITANKTEEIARLYTAMVDACERGGPPAPRAALQHDGFPPPPAALDGVRLFRNPGGRETRCGDCIRELRAGVAGTGGGGPP